MADGTYNVVTVPLPPKPKPGPKEGARRIDFVPYLEIARNALLDGSYDHFEKAAYRISRTAAKLDGIDADDLKSFLRYHLKQEFCTNKP